jgi:hypothetical protein
MPAAATGYSGTPLAKKLGIKAGTTLLSIGAPDNYLKLLAPLPDDLVLAKRPSATVDVVHLFTTQQQDLAKQLAGLRKTLKPDAAIWISWPKKASKVPTDVTEDTIRSVALPMGLVDIKVCAVTEVWSGLKLVLRKALR